MSGTIWFLRTMFCASILYMLLDCLSRKIKKKRLFRWVVCLLFLIVGWISGKYAIPGGQYFNICSVLFLYETGRSIHDLKLALVYPGDEKKNSVTIELIFIAFSCVALYCLKKIGGVAVNTDFITNPIFFVVCSLIGWLFFVQLSKLADRIDVARITFSYIGQHTLPIMLFHFASFKLITVSQIRLFHLENEKLQSFPCLIVDNGWWMLYTLCGIALPLIVYIGYSFIKQKYN